MKKNVCVITVDNIVMGGWIDTEDEQQFPSVVLYSPSYIGQIAVPEITDVFSNAFQKIRSWNLVSGSYIYVTAKYMMVGEREME